MKPAQWMGPAFPAFLAPSGATPFDTDLAELGTFCAVATTVPIAVLDPLLSSTESRRGPAYDLPVAKPVARDEVVQVAVPVNDYYAFRQLETAARTQDFVYHKAASATV